MNERRLLDHRLLSMLAGGVVVYALAARNDATLLQAGTYAAIYAIAAIGLSLLLGNVAQISIGQAGFFGIGAYAVGYATALAQWPARTPSWLPFVAGTLAGIGLATIAGLLLGFIALRFRGHFLAMATLAFGLIVVGIFRETAALGGSVGISNIPYPHFGALTISGHTAYWYAWFMAAVAVWLTQNLLGARSGRAFEAIRNDELAAETSGVPTRRYKIFAFAFAGALAGFAGSFDAAYLGLIEPNGVGVPLSIDLLLMVVLGGAGTVSGPIVGASLIAIANIYGHNLENWRPVVYGALVIGVAIGFPRGLVGLMPKPRPRRAVQTVANATFDDFAPAQVAGESAPASLVVANVIKRFGGLVAVDDVSFTLERGTLTALIGPNGAGKTTLFNAICGIGKPSAGRIIVAGVDVVGSQPHVIAALGVGRSFQNARLFLDMTVAENVTIGAFRLERSSFAADLFALRSSREGTRRATARGREILALLGIDHLAERPARELSFGDRRRVELARAVAARPHLLLVDEPAAGLNAAERVRLRADLRRLRGLGMTLLLIEHDMRLVMEISDRVMVLRLGKLIADGTPAAVRNDAHVVAAYLGTAG